MPASIVIKKDRDKPIRNQHPWIFSGAIDEVRGNPTPGEIVTVLSHKGDFLARGYWNAKSQIQVRLLTWQDESISEDWWRRMLKQSISARTFENYLHHEEVSTPYGYRVINAESDYLPGLMVDRYGDWLVLQALTLHIDQQKHNIARLLTDSFAELEVPVKGVYERSDLDVRKKEGLEQAASLLLGVEPPELISMSGLGERKVLVDVRRGHKTGYYLDQRHNHQYLWEFLATHFLFDARMLNLFSYTGGFGLNTDNYVVNVDASREVLELAEKTYTLNNFPADRVEFIQGDVFDYLRDIAVERQQFDVVVCDPPKFAQNAQQVDKAARGYKDLNLNSFKVIKPGGYLMTFSCSGAVSRDLFQKIVFGALADSGRQAQIVRYLGAGEDHPIALTFPEGEYLKGLLLRVY